ncbi:MAG TPA: 3'(2'),5'-bisphosphate nucleotidase CysQ [Myxococcota bacterium]|nr:3'(2'),5'-bisphosphate nucleotidase CysQ [Myxococcota bacterium]
MDLQAVHDLAVSAAREAGAAIRGYYKDSYTVKMKSAENPLTDADLAADRILEQRLKDAFLDTGWLSEETKADPTRVDKPYAWIIDPLDGTREFTLGIPEFCVSVAFIRGEEAVVGVLYNPIEEQLFSGIVGVGAWLNGESCSTTDHGALDGARVVCSRSEEKKGWFDPWKAQLDLIPTGSVAYKFGLVAAGLAEATFTNKPRNEWDIAGGVAIVHAAGGRTSNRHGQPYRFNQPNPLKDGVCGTNGAIHDNILGVMKQQAG